MTVTVANTDITNTFDYWRNRTNELAFAMSNKAVTTNSSPAVGDASITGNFKSNTVTIGLSDQNVIIKAPTPAEFAGGYLLSANGQWASPDGGIKTGSVLDSNPIMVDSWPTDSVAAAEYKLHFKAVNSDSYSYSKLSLLHDTKNAYITEYAMLVSNGQLTTVSANVNAGLVRVYVSAVGSGVNYRIARGSI